MSAVELEQIGKDEARRIVHWRFDTLVRAGYAERDALIVAMRLDADLHLAVDLVRRGCPSATAVRIVL